MEEGNGSYSDIAWTSCGTSIFASGDTIYELSGVDLEFSDIDEIELSGDECDILLDEVPDDSDCYGCVVLDELCRVPAKIHWRFHSTTTAYFRRMQRAIAYVRLRLKVPCE